MLRKTTAGRGLAALAVVLLLPFAAYAADPAAKPTGKPLERTDAAPDPVQLATPGPAHQFLRGFEGKWKTVSKEWHAPGEPTVSQGTSEARMILGGRYLEQRLRSKRLGRPFEAVGLTGYDNRKRVYTWTWADDATTTLMTGEGSMAAGNELVLQGTGEGPDGKPMNVRMVTRLVDPNRHVFTLYGTVDGSERLMMEITYTRL